MIFGRSKAKIWRFRKELVCQIVHSGKGQKSRASSHGAVVVAIPSKHSNLPLPHGCDSCSGVQRNFLRTWIEILIVES